MKSKSRGTSRGAAQGAREGTTPSPPDPNDQPTQAQGAPHARQRAPGVQKNATRVRSQNIEAGTKLQSPFVHVDVAPQPDDFTCGPTCLQAVYNYYGDEVPISEVVAGVETVVGGGTLAVNLACHALERGYDALLYTYDLNVFDPTWFELSTEEFLDKLRAQRRAKRDPRLHVASSAYIRFLQAGGRLKFEELQEGLLRRHLSRGQPILTGLSATYLYGCAREFREEYDDVRGEPTGHFVVLSGYDRSTHQVHVADPLHDNPGYPGHRYAVGVSRFIASVLLGVLTYDANLLVLTPKKGRR